ncbi:MAG: hypothetical protein EOO96_10165 [Pedobacter sp.]|nr:MAG: hypothetical protein EOO96_10165 [Pedobacter sp.]
MKIYQYFLLAHLMLIFSSCTGQNNPKYIGKKFGVFNLDKISFDENLDTLFSKSDFFVIADKNSYYDTIKNKEIYTDTMAYIYRIPHAKVDGLYSFKGIKIKDKVVSFTADKNKKFRKLDFSIYISEDEYSKLLNDCKDFKDITTEQIRKANNNKYIILQKTDNHKQTTLYCLDDRRKKGDFNYGTYTEGDFFIRITINDLRIKDDAFYKRENNDLKP